MAIISSGIVDYPAGSETASYEVPIPADAEAGDVLIVKIDVADYEVSVDEAPGSVATLIAQSENPTANHYDCGLYGYEVSSSSPGSLTWTMTGAVRGNAVWVLLRGHTLNGAVASVLTWAVNGTAIVPAVTATAGAWILGGVAAGSGTITVTAPSGWSALQSAVQRKGYVASKGAQASAGSSGTATFTLSSGSSDRRAWQLALPATAEDPEPEPELSTLSNLILGIPSSTGISVRAKSDANTARLKAGTNSAVTTGVVFGSPATSDDAGWCALSSRTLAPDTQYWLQVEMTNGEGVSLSTAHGPFRTAPAPGTATSFEFAFGGDIQEDQSNARAFTNLAAHDDDVRFFLSTGDTHNGDNSSTSQSSHRQDWENIWSTNAGFKALVANTPFAQTYGDHDAGGGNNGVPGAWTAPNIAAYQQVLAPPPSPMLPNNTAWSFVWGRVRFISLDLTHQRTASYKISPEQMSWLEGELNEPEPLKVLLVGAVWYDEEEAEGWPDGDGWVDYAHQRDDIVDLINASKAAGNTSEVLALHGDQHALAAMSGAGNPYGGFPVVGGSPLSGWASHKGDVTPDNGRWPLNEDNIVHQHAVVSVQDSGDEITVTYRGYDDDNVARVSMAFNLVTNAPAPTITASELTNPVGRWQGKATRLSWWDGSRWGAVLPTDLGHAIFPDLTDLDEAGPVVDDRQSARATVIYHGNTLGVLRGHGSATRYSSYDASNGYAPIVSDASVPLTSSDLDAAPVTLYRSLNGYLWAACMTGGQVRVSRSTNGGATWGAAQTITTIGNVTGVAGITGTGTTVVLVASANDGAGRAVRTIAQGASSYGSGSWSTETLPALPSGVTSDDHLDLGTMADGRVIVVSKTTDATTTSQPLIYLLTRSTSGTWTSETIEPGPDDDPRYTRPALALEPGALRVLYGEIDDPNPGSLYTRIGAPGAWSSRTILDSTGNRADSAVAPAREHIAGAVGAYPILTHDRSSGDIDILWVTPTPAEVGPRVIGVIQGGVLVPGQMLGIIQVGELVPVALREVVTA